MIHGVVNDNLEAIISIRLGGPGGLEQDIEAVIDTGFNGFLIVSPALVGRMGLLRIGRSRVQLANGQEEFLDLYEVRVLWDGHWQIVETDAAETDALVGMSLARGYSVYVEAVEGSRVVIEPLP